MANYWLFVVVDARVGGSIVKARDILDTRIKGGYWLLNRRSPFFRIIDQGDRILLYLGGSGERKFAGHSRLSSRPKRLAKAARRFIIENLDGRFTHSVELGQVKIFDKPKNVTDFLSRLSFVKGSKKWGAYFQGSIIRMERIDFETVLKG